jgi:hypothetical protein
MDFFIVLELVFWLYLLLGTALSSMGQVEAPPNLSKNN